MYLEVPSMFEKKPNYSTNIKELIVKYSDRKNAEMFFYQLKWPNGFVCSKCGCNKADYIENRHVYQCRECKHQESVTAKTALNSTKLPLLDWILVMFVFVVSKTGISAQCISDITGVSYKSVKLMLRKIKAAQKENNDKYPVLNCDAIEMDTFLFGGKKAGKRGLGAEGKACVAVAAIKDNVEYTDKNTGENVVGEKLKAVKFKIIPSENKVSITDFINESIPSDCLISCDASRTNKSLKLEGKLMDIQAFEKGNNHLTSADHMISNLKKKVDGLMHGIELQYIENELADFEWKIARRKRNGKQLLESLGRTLIHGAHKTRKGLIQHFKQVEEDMALMYA